MFSLLDPRLVAAYFAAHREDYSSCSDTESHKSSPEALKSIVAESSHPPAAAVRFNPQQKTNNLHEAISEINQEMIRNLQNALFGKNLRQIVKQETDCINKMDKTLATMDDSQDSISDGILKLAVLTSARHYVESNEEVFQPLSLDKLTSKVYNRLAKQCSVKALASSDQKKLESLVSSVLVQNPFTQ